MRGERHQSGSPSSPAAASSSFSFRRGGGRSLLSFRRNQVVSMENAQEQELHELDLFHSHVARRLLCLSSATSSFHHHHNDGENHNNRLEQQQQEEEKQKQQHLITLPFLRKLLDAFTSIEEDFKALLLTLLARDPSLLSRPPLDRLASDLFDHAVRSLDVLNAVTYALDSLHHCHAHAEIAASALHHGGGGGAVLGEAQFHRARRALTKLLASISPEIAGGSGSGRSAAFAERAWSFRGGIRSMSRKQMQAAWGNLSSPRGGDATALAMAVYTMGAVQAFLVRILLVSFPYCQETGGGGGHGSDSAAAAAVAAMVSSSPPRQLLWAAPMVALQERIVEEWRRKERKGFSSSSSSSSSASVGLLAELQMLERSGRGLVEMEGSVKFPLLEETKREEIGEIGRELAEVCRVMEEEINPFRRQIREVFHRIARSRAEILVCLGRSDRNSSSPVL